MASGSQVYRGIWADLPVAPTKRHRVMAVMTPLPTGYLAARGEDFPEVDGPEGPEDQENAQEETEVADPVDHKGLFAGVAGGLLLIPEADEQIGAEPHAFPAHEHQEEVVGAHQNQHEEDEEVEVGEVPGEPSIIVHVADGVDMDDKADPGNHQQHDEG
jgi:hypothetical protein